MIIYIPKKGCAALNNSLLKEHFILSNTNNFSVLPFPPQEAINLLEPMTNDPVNYVRQGALIASALIMIQQTEVTCPKVKAKCLYFCFGFFVQYLFDFFCYH